MLFIDKVHELICPLKGGKKKKGQNIFIRGRKGKMFYFKITVVRLICSLIDYAHTKMFFIKGWNLSDKVSPIVACFFFCHKFLVILSRQDLIDNVAAQHEGF